MSSNGKTLDVLRGLVFAAARRFTADPDLSAKIADAAVTGIVGEFGSTKVYIPDGSEARRRARAEVVAANFKAGMPMDRIARRVNLSYRQVASIVRSLGLRDAEPGG